MALIGTQLSLDLGGTAWITLKSMHSLVRSASVDDVQPLAVTAMAHLGALMEVDTRLIGPASEALGGDNSIRLEQIKLSFGILSGGVASELRKTSATVRAFLLISGLGTCMSDRVVSEVLMELMLRSKIIDDVVIGPSQLLKLVEAIKGNTQALFKEGHMPPEILDPIVTLATTEGKDAYKFFSQLHAHELAALLLEVFNAIRDDDVGRIRISGAYGAISIVGVLRWLCPDRVEVKAAKGTLLAESTIQPAKVTIILDHQASGHRWQTETWYVVETQKLFNDQKDTFNALHHDPMEETVPFADTRIRPPCVLLYALWQSLPGLTLSDLSNAANLGLGLVNAVLQVSKIERDDIRGVPVVQSLQFREICSPEFLSAYMDFPTYLGCSKESINPQLVQMLGNRISEHVFESGGFEFDGEYFSDKTVSWLDEFRKEFFGMSPLDKQDSALYRSQAWEFALQIADLALLSATRIDLSRSMITLPPQEAQSGHWQKDRLVIRLLGRMHSVKASEYLQSALLAANGPNSGVPTDPMIAIAGHGHVCFLSSFLRPPNQLCEAFRIVVKPGQIKWRNASIRYMYGSKAPGRPSGGPNPASLPIDVETKSNPSSLRVLDYRPFKYFMSAGQQEGSVHLICERQDVTDNYADFTSALIHWAVALRTRPSGRSPEQLALVLEKAGISKLQVKHPACAALHCQNDWAVNIRALATYNDRETLPFLQFGTIDPSKLHCIIQGEASLLDSVVQAFEAYGSGWVIMTNP